MEKRLNKIHQIYDSSRRLLTQPILGWNAHMTRRVGPNMDIKIQHSNSIPTRHFRTVLESKGMRKVDESRPLEGS